MLVVGSRRRMYQNDKYRNEKSITKTPILENKKNEFFSGTSYLLTSSHQALIFSYVFFEFQLNFQI